MGKSNKIENAIKQVFKDITNINEVLEDSKKVQESVNNTNFEDENATVKVIEDTKVIIDRLKDDIDKISEYFDENCKIEQCVVNNIDSEVVTEKDDNKEISASNSNDTNKDIESEPIPEPNAESVSDVNIETSAENNTTSTNANCNETNENGNENTISSNEVPDLNVTSSDCAITNQPNDATHENADLIEKNHNKHNDETNKEDMDHKDKSKTKKNKRQKRNCKTKKNSDDMISSEDTDASNTNEQSVEDADETNANENGKKIKKESKVFLKCIDINKLKPTPSGLDNSVLIISDSEPENDVRTSRKTSKTKAALEKTGIIEKLISNIHKEITVSKISKNAVVVNVDDDGKSTLENGNNASKVTGTETSVASKEDCASKNISKLNKKLKDPLKATDVKLNSTSSDSDDSYKRKKIRRILRRLPKPSRREKRSLDIQHDKKFGYHAYVLLTRYPCEKLKELYLQKKDLDEVKRLTDLSNVKKRKRGKCKGSDSSSTDKRKKKSKRKRNLSKDSHTSKTSDEDDDNVLVIEDNPVDNTDSPVVILNDVDSATDASGSESNKKKKNKTSNKKKKSGDEESESGDSNNKKKKKKWRRDKLLKKQTIESDSDSEDEFAKFKKDREKSKHDVKKRLAKKKSKNLIDSDSSSNASKRKSKKKKSSSSEEPSSSESSSSSSESESEASNKKKKGSRIKRVKESSSSDDDKTTRKAIRKIKGTESLKETTKQAEKEEIERKARILERQKKYNAIFESDKPQDSTVEKVVLDFDEHTKEELVSVNKDIVSKLKPHQAKGIQFMWNACFESLERTKSTNGSGCILAHCMGLGKTLQVIAFAHAIMLNEKTSIDKVMVVCPLNTVLNWVDEFKKWLTDIDGPEIEVYELVSNKQLSYREYLVKQWTKHGGVLIIGYDMFRNLTNPTNKRIRKQTREVFQKGMVDPGPDLIVCDEGHLLKNEKTHLSVAISRVRTERRIVLTGTPMQNNMKEYYCMVQFVKPNLLGTYKEYLNRFVNPITNGQYTDSTPHDISIMKKRSHVLHKMLDGIVQRKDYNVLAPFLPPKYEYVLFTRLSEVQIKLYQYYLDNLARRPVESKIRKTTFLFSDFQEFQRICTHPRVLLIKTIENQKKAMFTETDDDSEGSLKDFIDDDDDGASKTSSSSSSSSGSSSNSDSDVQSSSKKKKGTEKNGKKGPAGRMTRNSAAAAGIEVTQSLDDIVINDGDEVNNWWRKIVDGDELENIALGGKLYLLFEILQQCELIGDKILIFSQSLYSLNIIEYFLHKIDDATQDGKSETVAGFSGSWAAGLDYFRIDGSSSCDNRAAWCKSFNNPDNLRARLFLISTRAGGLGINLVGANRVIIFDVSWNPSHDIQSIYRVYRFGQTKPCYIYRFVTYGTMEMKIYERQVTKQAISKRVIDEQQIDRHYNQNDLAELYNFDPAPVEAPTPLVPKDVLLAELLQKEKDRIYKYHEHQSLLENKEGEELDEAERKAAWEEYEHEKTNPPVNMNSAGVAGAGGWIKNLPLTSINAALLNILQKDNPTWTRDQVLAVIPIVVQQLREQVDKGETLLFNRIVNELKIIQAQQQQKLQQYYMQQQMRILQQQQLLAARGQKLPAANTLRNIINSAMNSNANVTHSNEVVELND